MFHEPPACLYKSLLQARQRPVFDPTRQDHPPPRESSSDSDVDAHIRFRVLILILRPGELPTSTARVVRISAAVPAVIFNRERWVYRTRTTLSLIVLSPKEQKKPAGE